MERQNNESYFEVEPNMSIFTEETFPRDCNFDSENSKLVPEDEAVEEIQIEVIDHNEPEVAATQLQNLLSGWIKSVLPLLKPGGKSVALILALGLVSIPLLVSGSVWVAPILAVGATIVAILSCI